MSTRFASAAQITVVRLAIAAALAAAVFVGLLGGSQTATAVADGNSTCSNGSGTSVNCIGTVNGNTVNIDISKNKVLSGNELNILTVELDKVLISVINLPVSVQVNTIATKTVLILKALNVQICDVKVAELGLVNTNIAKCEL